ncbi:MAG: C-GCAxxG-C-C family protein [Oscillospiraceae bacterium]|nr:C-GCAxxG-C-C family protein [Oscillospiraceae bacterium]
MKITKAEKCFSDGLNCAQAVFSTHGDRPGLDTETALKIASGFGSGMGRLCETCGAVTGAYMAIGLRFGHSSADDLEAKIKTYGLVQEFSRRFKERNQSTLCEELLGFNMNTTDKEMVRQRVKIVCPKLVKDSAEILEELLKDN